MLVYIVAAVVVGLFFSGGYYYKIKQRKQGYVENALDLPEFDELIVDFEEDEIQRKITKMHEP
tara:strand:+ start:2631 stop:2819 length:189 start_codon:yes stop_codon:yes gene_type:complete